MSIVKKLMFLFVMAACMFGLQVNAFAQAKCLFVSEGADPHSQDVILVDWLENTYGAQVDIATGDDVSSGFYIEEDFQAYDFLFVSESVSSSDSAPLKGVPVPIFTTELWGAKWDVYGWVPTNQSGTYYENTSWTAGENTVLILDDSSPLAAGYTAGTELIIATDSDDMASSLTYCVPQIEHIAIAGLAADASKIIVVGVEAGTALYNEENVNDGSLVSTSRMAAVGINANSNNHLTDDAFALIKAGLDWILADPTVSVENADPIPNAFGLAQNYPNPFNPTTRITFEITEPAFTTLKVYNSLGQEVASVLEGHYNAGSHTVEFDATDLTTGIYFYQLRSGKFSQVKKMILSK